MDTITKYYMPLILSIILLYMKIINGDLDILREKNKRKIRKLTPYCRLRVRSNDVDAILNGNETTTQKHLRINAASFKKILAIMPVKRNGWCNEFELIVFLYWMACGCSYRVAGGFIGISRSTVCRIVHKMLDFFIEYMRHMIRAPSTDEFEEIGKKFCTRAKSNIFRNAIGAIDGCHVRIACPVQKHDEYINYKSFYSIQCQAVVDSSHMFRDIFVGFPGSVHDTRVLRNSPLYQKGIYTPENYYLLGDSGYPCQLRPVSIITPYKNTNNIAEKKFNTLHSKARNIVECSFGLLKMRWRNIFNKSLELEIKNSIKTVFVACILHNICVSGGDFGPLEEANAVLNGEKEIVSYESEEINEVVETVIVNDSPDAVMFRNILLQNIGN